MSKPHFMRRMALLSMALFVVTCDLQATSLDLTNSTLDKPFTCTYEKDPLPPIDPKVDTLYRYAHYLDSRNAIRQDPAVMREIEHLSRIATAHGDYRASLGLRQMILRTLTYSDNPAKEIPELTERVIQQNLASSYYDMPTYIEHGIGVEANTALALKYYRKYAELGSPAGLQQKPLPPPCARPLHISLCFDGTNNNKDNDIKNSHSNIV